MSVRLRLSLMWLFLLGGLGFFFPYYSLFLRENAGLSGTQVGLVMAIPPLAGLFMQPVWGQISDRIGARQRVLVWLTTTAALLYTALLLPRGFVGFAAGTALLSIFAVALIPTAVAVSLALMPERAEHGLGQVRVWGTVGFGLCVVSLPPLARALPAVWPASAVAAGEHGLEAIFWLAGGAVAVASLLARTLPRGGAEATRAARGDWRLLLRHGPFLRLLGFVFAAFLFLQGPMVLFPLLVRAQGGGLEALSGMWIVMLLLEVPLVALLGASAARLGVRGLVSLGVLAGALRWIVSGFAPALWMVTAAQILHGIVVWGLILGGPLYVDRVVPERLRSTGQGMLAMVGASLGGMLSNIAAGWLVDRLGATAPAQVGGIGALVLVCLVPWILPRPPARGARIEEVDPG